LGYVTITLRILALTAGEVNSQGAGNMTLKSTFTSLFHLPPKNIFRWFLLVLLPLAILFGVTRWSAKGAWEVLPPNAPQVNFNMALQMAYFTQDNDWDSTIVLNNNAKEERFVQVTLYGKGGQPLNVPMFSIPANSIRRFKLADWTQEANNFREGNINVATHGKPMDITGQVSIVNRRDRLEFESKPSMTAEYSSQRLNGIVTLPDRQAKAYVALTNTSANPIEVSLTSDAEHVHADNVNLAAHETKVEEIKLQNGDKSSLSALVTLQHNGSVGALITAAYAVNKHTGFTANLYFYDDAKTVSNRLAAAHFRYGEANPAEGFPAGTIFKAPLVLANLGNVPSTATVTVDYTQNGQAKKQSIGSFRLASRAVKEIELHSMLTRLGVTGLVDNAGLDINYTGSAGTLVGQLTSMSTDGDYSFDVPVKDPLAGFNRNTGSYPFRLDDGYNTVLHLKNTTDKTVYAVAQIRYEGGGTYNPDQIKLEPFQTVAMDIRRFQATQARDIRNRALPMDVVSGKVIWYERTPGSLIGRAETADFSAGIAGSFSCGGNCTCGMQTTSAYMDPYYFLSEVGDHGYPFTPMEMLEDCNGDYDYGPYAITGWLNWSSSNSSIATVSGGYVECVSPGVCNINFIYNAIIDYDGDYSCNPAYNNFYDSGQIDVNPKVTGVTAQGAEMVTGSGSQNVMHFVTPKGQANETVTLIATVTPNTQTVINQVTWEGATQDANDRLKATVPKDTASKKVVRIRINGRVSKEIRVWIVWATITSTDTPLDYTDTANLYMIRGGYQFTHSIQPSSIITDGDRPNLSGANVNAPPGGTNWEGVSLSGGATTKWDNSRQVRHKWIDPNGLVAASCCGSLPAISYPSNEVEGNDDTSVCVSQPCEEVNDPYSNSATLTGQDRPFVSALHGAGVNGNTIESRIHFREFTRLEINGVWYRISDYYLWRVHRKWIKANGKWTNNSSTKALNNDGY
jgi:hypothetical protein